MDNFHAVSAGKFSDDVRLVFHGILLGLGGRAKLLGGADIPVESCQEISPDTYLNIMPQYHPSYRAARFPPMEQRDIRQWYAQALVLAREAGLHRLDRRPLWE